MKAYDDALQMILDEGYEKPNRTGINSISLFGIQQRYPLAEFPILTRRKMNYKAVFAELLWFLSGSTNNNDLVALGCNYWTPWVDDRWSSAKGLRNGLFGPTYGFQLRNFGQPYRQDGSLWTLGKRYECVDQWRTMIETTKNDPNSRRNLFDLWNPGQLDDMKLPPCAYSFQVYAHGNFLSGMLTQRSCDFPVGVPANIQFYATLLYILAEECGYRPYELIHSCGDAHIYVNQIPMVEEYLSRPTVGMVPRLLYKPIPDILCREPKKEWIDECFQVINYEPLESIKFPVAV